MSHRRPTVGGTTLHRRLGHQALATANQSCPNICEGNMPRQSVFVWCRKNLLKHSGRMSRLGRREYIRKPHIGPWALRGRAGHPEDARNDAATIHERAPADSSATSSRFASAAPDDATGCPDCRRSRSTRSALRSTESGESSTDD